MNNIKELKGVEQNIFAKAINNYSIETEKNNIISDAQKYRRLYEEKVKKINTIKRQINFLKIESLDLTEEISRLLNELEINWLDEKYR